MIGCKRESLLRPASSIAPIALGGLQCNLPIAVLVPVSCNATPAGRLAPRSRIPPYPMSGMLSNPRTCPIDHGNIVPWFKQDPTGSSPCCASLVVGKVTLDPPFRSSRSCQVSFTNYRVHNTITTTRNFASLPSCIGCLVLAHVLGQTRQSTPNLPGHLR